MLDSWTDTTARPPDLHLRRAPGRPQPVAGDRAVHGRRGDVLARGAGRHPGDPRLGDRLEKLAFNALPATFKKDMTAHQYDQQCNQVICSAEGRARLRQQRARLEPLRPGAELRLLHGQHAPGLAQVCLASLDEDRRRRAGGDRVRAVRGRDADCRASRCGSRSVLSPLIRSASERIADCHQGSCTGKELVSPCTCGSRPGRAGATCGIWENATTFERASRPQARGVLDARPGMGRKPADRARPDASRCPCGCARVINGAVAIERGPVVYALHDRRRVEDGQGQARICRLTTGRSTRSHPGTTPSRSTAMHPEQSVVFEPKKPSWPVSSRSEGARLVAKVKGRRVPGWGLENGAAAPPPAEPRRQQGAARGTDADSLRMHRPENHRVSHWPHGLAVR